jgi:hypothetical protein
MKISIAKKSNELNALFIEKDDMKDWNNVLCKMKGYRFDQVFAETTLTMRQVYDIMCYCKGKIYECRNIYE